MTNQQIIANVAASIFGEDAVMEMIKNGKDIPLHTIKGWAARGQKVRKGEHGIETKLWKKRKSMANSSDENQSEEAAMDFYMAKAFLFRKDQVELAKEE